jgi:hypothetical protein
MQGRGRGADASLVTTLPVHDGPDTAANVADRLRANPARVPMSGESLVPWLAAAASAFALVMAGFLSGRHWSSLEWGVLVLGLFGLVAATSLVALRSRAETGAADREERTRPAPDELMVQAADRGDAAVGAEPGSPPYVVGMARWAASFLELMEHAVVVATETGRAEVADELSAAREDTLALRELLDSSRGGGFIGVNETASLHAICTLWETNQGRYEALAAQVDGPWHRRWRARSVVERRLRHGAAPTDAMVLPYST